MTTSERMTRFMLRRVRRDASDNWVTEPPTVYAWKRLRPSVITYNLQRALEQGEAVEIAKDPNWRLGTR